MLESSGGEGLGTGELKDGSGFESEKTSAKWQFRSSHFETVDSAVIEPFSVQLRLAQFFFGESVQVL